MSDYIFTIPIIAGFAVQFIKFLLKVIRKDFKLKDLFGAFGDMPSSHSAFVISLATLTLLKEGITSSAFIISLIFAILVIREATGFRKYIESHSKILNHYKDKLPTKEKKKLPELEKRLGHTWPEAIIGGILGFLITVALLYI